MKQINLILCLLLSLCYMPAHAQASDSTTVRSIFALRGGDSLQYRIWTTAQVCGTVCSVYRWYVVDTVFGSAGQDTLTVFYHDMEEHMDSIYPGATAPCAPACYHYIDLCARSSSVPRYWTLPYADSGIYTSALSIHYSISRDSVVSDLLKYNGARQHVIHWGDNIMADGVDIFVDSLGPVYHEMQGYESSNAQNQELIYYHKANGTTWGQRYVYTGLEEVRRSAMSIYPNPATGYMTIQADSYQDVIYELYDILGQKVGTGPLKATETNVDVRVLAPGIYHCHLLYAGQSVKSLKLIID